MKTRGLHAKFIFQSTFYIKHRPVVHQLRNSSATAQNAHKKIDKKETSPPQPSQASKLPNVEFPSNVSFDSTEIFQPTRIIKDVVVDQEWYAARKPKTNQLFTHVLSFKDPDANKQLFDHIASLTNQEGKYPTQYPYINYFSLNPLQQYQSAFKFKNVQNEVVGLTGGNSVRNGNDGMKFGSGVKEQEVLSDFGLRRISLNKKVFTTDVRFDVMHNIVRWQRAKARQGTSKVKTISERSGTGRKPWQQKGLGKARHGSRRAVQWRKGGRVHGPVGALIRNYNFKLNKKYRKLGVRSCLAAKFIENNLLVVDKFEGSDEEMTKRIRTKEVVDFLTSVGCKDSKVMFVDEMKNEALTFGVRNLPQLTRVVPQIGCTVMEMLLVDKVVISENALRQLEKRLTELTRRGRASLSTGEIDFIKSVGGVDSDQNNLENDEDEFDEDEVEGELDDEEIEDEEDDENDYDEIDVPQKSKNKSEKR